MGKEKYTHEFSLEITYNRFLKSNSPKSILKTVKYTIYKGYIKEFFTTNNKEALKIKLDLLGVRLGNHLGYVIDPQFNYFETKTFWLWNKS